MRILSGARLGAVLVTLPLMLATVPAVAEPPARDGHHHGDQSVRFQTFNASLNRLDRGRAGRATSPRRRPAGRHRRGDHPAHPPRRAAAQRVRLRPERGGRRPVPGQLPRGGATTAPGPSTTATRSSRRPTPASRAAHDLDNNGTVGGGNDAFGFGDFPGHFGMAVSQQVPDRLQARRGPSRSSAGRTCRTRCCPTTRPRTRRPTGTPPRSSRSSGCRASRTGTCRSGSADKTVHFLVSHPTPPVFDGPEDRNGKRNFDEIRFWADYVVRPRLHVRRPGAPRRPARRARGS